MHGERQTEGDPQDSPEGGRQRFPAPHRAPLQFRIMYKLFP
jgi:hypothetical protein